MDLAFSRPWPDGSAGIDLPSFRFPRFSLARRCTYYSCCAHARLCRNKSLYIARECPLWYYNLDSPPRRVGASCCSKYNGMDRMFRERGRVGEHAFMDLRGSYLRSAAVQSSDGVCVGFSIAIVAVTRREALYYTDFEFEILWYWVCCACAVR